MHLQHYGTLQLHLQRRSLHIRQQTPHQWWHWRPSFLELVVNEQGVEVKALSEKQLQASRKMDEHTKKPSSGERGISSLQLMRRKAVGIFFPKAYPQSVTPNYWAFTKWNLVASVGGTLTGALLRALGMGAEGAIPVAATLNWVIKDGFGLLGGVIYTSIFSGRFDSEPKRYRFNAAVCLQLAALSELLTTLFPGYFLVMASLSNIGKNIAWLTLSGTRAQMHQSLCLRDNLGDVTAKAGSQTTAAGLIGISLPKLRILFNVLGTGLGVGVAALVGDSFTSSMMAFLPLTTMNLYSIYRSNCSVSTKSLNLQRTELILNQYLYSPTATIPSPRDVSKREKFVSRYHSVFSIPLIIGMPLTRLKQIVNDSSDMQAIFNHSSFRSTSNESTGQEHYYLYKELNGPVYLWMDEKASSTDILKGMFHACLVRSPTREESPTSAYERTLSDFASFHEGLKSKGWNVDDLVFQHIGSVSVQ